MIKLSFLNPTLHNILEFSRVVSRCGVFRHLKMGLNHIAHIPQQQCGALLNLLRSAEIQRTCSAFHHRAGCGGGDRGFDLVAPQIGEADGGTDMDAVDAPPHSRMPVNGLDQPSGR